MLLYSTTINEIFTHIHEKIASQVCRKMIGQLGLTDVFKNHLYFNSDVTGPSRSYSERRLPILHENAFRCSIKYSTNPFGLKWDSTTAGQHMDPGIHRWDNMRTPPVFWDQKHGITLIERYLPCNIELDCNMLFTDRVVAFDVMNRITSTYVRGELLMVNDLSYDYSLPDGVICRLQRLASLMGQHRGTYMDWLDEYSGGQIKRIVSTRQTNRSAELVVQKHQYSSLAAVDYVPDSPDFVTQGTSLDVVQLHFTVTIQFGRVNMLYLKYPVVINNKLVPEDLVTVDPRDAYGPLYRFLRHPEYALNPAYQFQKCLMSHPARTPWYDDWDVPPYSGVVASEQRPFFIGLVLLDRDVDCTKEKCDCKECDNSFTKVDISTDLDQYKLAPDVLKWYEEHPKEALDTESKYSITLFRNNIQVSPASVKFDGHVFSFPNCRGVGHIYHVVLSAATRKFDGKSPWTSLILMFDIEPNRERVN